MSAAQESLFSFVRRLSQSRDPRRFRECAICHDTGMVENDRYEDVCPACEGGIWRQREPWRAWASRVRLPFGLRVSTIGRVRLVLSRWEP